MKRNRIKERQEENRAKRQLKIQGLPSNYKPEPEEKPESEPETKSLKKESSKKVEKKVGSTKK